MKRSDGMQLIREAMEGLLDAQLASSIIGEALSGADEPTESEQLLSFVRGPLRAVAISRVGSARAGDLVERAEFLFRSMGVPNQTLRARGRAAQNTVEVSLPRGPSRVAIISGNRALERGLRAAFAGENVGVQTSKNLVNLENYRNQFKPEVIIVDAVDPICDHDGLAHALGSSQRNKPICVVWGCEQPWGVRMTQVLENHNLAFVPMDRKEGVYPLMDLIRSRQT